jgi:hypothetical protein
MGNRNGDVIRAVEGNGSNPMVHRSNESEGAIPSVLIVKSRPPDPAPFTTTHSELLAARGGESGHATRQDAAINC